MRIRLQAKINFNKLELDFSYFHIDTTKVFAIESGKPLRSFAENAKIVLQLSFE